MGCLVRRRVDDVGAVEHAKVYSLQYTRGRGRHRCQAANNVCSGGYNICLLCVFNSLQHVDFETSIPSSRLCV